MDLGQVTEPLAESWNGHYFQYHLNTAKEFLSCISPNRDESVLPISNPEIWIFRGQSEDLPLLASLFRDNVFSKFAELTGSYGVLNIEKQLPTEERRYLFRTGLEYNLVCRFIDIADRQGISIPGFSYESKNRLFGIGRPDIRGRIIQESDLIEYSDYPLLALAQHYGLLTRLLDWTENPFIAAYFAAIGAVINEDLNTCKTKNINDTIESQNCKNKKIVVWALDWIVASNSNKLQIIRVPFSGNENLKAQAGLFTLTFSNQKLLPPPIETIDFNDSKLTVSNGSALCKFTLPYSETPRLLYLLSNLGCNASNIFPGFSGIVRRIREQKYQTSFY